MPPGRKQRLRWTFLLSSRKRGARNSADSSQPWRRARCSCSRSSEQLQREFRQIPVWQLDPQLPPRSIQHWGHKKEHREHPTENGLIKPPSSGLTRFPWVILSSGHPELLQTSCTQSDWDEEIPQASPCRKTRALLTIRGVGEFFGHCSSILQLHRLQLRPHPLDLHLVLSRNSILLRPRALPSSAEFHHPESTKNWDGSFQEDLPAGEAWNPFPTKVSPHSLPPFSTGNAGICVWIWFPMLGWDLILGFGHRGCYCAIHKVIKPQRS